MIDFDETSIIEIIFCARGVLFQMCKGPMLMEHQTLTRILSLSSSTKWNIIHRRPMKFIDASISSSVLYVSCFVIEFPRKPMVLRRSYMMTWKYRVTLMMG
jgi:hypothetical protein